ncbi:hypothetical protein HMPREF1554_02263 [Porphyromonas gingivalis F0569]|nr:hypothetical protein HMPREF1554_02263 [Porphyromonas gingivalis F0569]
MCLGVFLVQQCTNTTPINTGIDLTQERVFHAISANLSVDLTVCLVAIFMLLFIRVKY